MFVRDLDRIFLPAAADVPAALRKLAAAHDKLSAEASQAADERHRLEQSLPKAEADDQAAYAAALRAGKSDPGTANTDRTRADIDKAKRHADAAQLAAQQAATELQAAVNDGRPAWLAELEGEQVERRRALDAAIDRLAEARAAVVTVDATATWLRGFPSRRGPRDGVPPLRALTATNRAPTQWLTVLSALQSEAAPPVARHTEPTPAA